MTLTHILAFILYALIVGLIIPARWRGWVLLGGSLAAVYWLQPSTPIRHLDFWLPTVSIALTVFVWAVISYGKSENQRLSLVSSFVVISVVLVIGLLRYIEPLCCAIPTRPPEIWRISLALALAGLAVILPYRLAPNNRFWPNLAIFIILVLFVTLKTEHLSLGASAWLRYSTGQSVELASALDLPWLGFSYLAFRLLHALRDHQGGKLPAYELNEFITYAIFFPAYTAGPIDRSQHFIKELRAVASPETESGGVERKTSNIITGGQRILWGVFKKFVLADSLALIALDSQNAVQTSSPFWMWVLLYAYALRIYFDFSGYTDIALGLGYFMGFKLPENFDRPYFKLNLTAFWNSWHITLAQWFRAYFFNPVTRMLRTRPQHMPTWAIILIGQFSTMLLIGIWHGVTWNFAVWGAWHGLGLFLHNRWLRWIRPRFDDMKIHSLTGKFLNAGSWLLTFNYVALGWVWFAMPNLELSIEVFRKLGNF